MSPPPKLSRRTLTIGAGMIAGAVVVAGATFEIPHLFKRRPRGEYADLVNRLDNPEQAAIVGRAIHFNGMEGDMTPSGRTFEDISAQDLKSRLAKHSVPELMKIDSSTISKMFEVDGWVIPVVLAEFCLLAAQSV